MEGKVEREREGNDVQQPQRPFLKKNERPKTAVMKFSTEPSDEPTTGSGNTIKDNDMRTPGKTRMERQDPNFFPHPNTTQSGKTKRQDEI